ncbi:hypothetical protein HanXRQr2_Chr17g0808211 [Helianthus annuus]|uniref:Uncharacterized protein n=1 Tax=Helianthus annuus TaxID=4232 RepID=A0A9K3DJQ8_HELAN|nr:hypothetical protein HanXRQr2_Chr17g0808211 [Helianthus annuus]KAJ0813628.1 hypothetical protein HanPSC8_Chr17g0775721 [Helianthus annuus]
MLALSACSIEYVLGTSCHCNLFLGTQFYNPCISTLTISVVNYPGLIQALEAVSA